MTTLPGIGIVVTCSNPGCLRKIRMPRKARKRDDLLCVSIPFPSSFSIVRSFARSFASRYKARRRPRAGRERERERKKNSKYIYIYIYEYIHTHEEMFLLLVLPLYIYIFYYITYTLFSIIPIDRNPLLYYVVIVSAISEPFVMVAVDEHARHICSSSILPTLFLRLFPVSSSQHLPFPTLSYTQRRRKDWE